MNLAPDTTLVRNPEPPQRPRLRAHEQTVTELEQKIGQHHTTISSTDTNPAETLCMLQADLHTARAATLTADKALKPIPAKLLANTIDPDVLIDQLNHHPPKLAGDHRQINYQTPAKP